MPGVFNTIGRGTTGRKTTVPTMRHKPETEEIFGFSGISYDAGNCVQSGFLR